MNYERKEQSGGMSQGFFHRQFVRYLISRTDTYSASLLLWRIGGMVLPHALYVYGTSAEETVRVQYRYT